jgi:hypothetical protein
VTPRARLLPEGVDYRWLGNAERRRLEVMDAILSGDPMAKADALAFLQSYGAEALQAVSAALLNDHLASLEERHAREEEMDAFKASRPARLPWLTRVFGPLLTRRTA